MSSNLLQCMRLNPSPSWHVPLQRDGTSDISEAFFAPSVVSGSSPVVAHMMATGGLHGR